MISDLTVWLGGHSFRLLHERAAFWDATGTLLIADPHFGKAATFRSAGLFVPRGTTGSAIARLESMLQRLTVRRILFLGDFLHAREGRATRTLDALREWRTTHPQMEITLIRGNHDRGAGDPPRDLGIHCVDAPLLESGFAFAHHPVSVPGSFVFAGHLHPGVRLVGRGRQRQRLPCFWAGREICVLPAFGDFTGMAMVEPQPDDRVFVVADEAVVQIAAAQEGRYDG